MSTTEARSANRAFSRRDFLRLSAAASTAAYLAACGAKESPAPSGSGPVSSAAASPSLDVSPSPSNAFDLGPLGGPTLITDPAQSPTTFSEAPALAALVQAGQLPPVQERIGKDPIVLKPLEGIGTYGGNIRRGFEGSGDIQNANRFCSGPDTPFYWDYEYKAVTPWLAKGFEWSGDGRTMTIHLREGLKWSDGHPVTADDVLFCYEELYGNDDLGVTFPTYYLVNGKPMTLTKIDDYTVSLTMDTPSPLLPEAMSSSVAGESFFYDEGVGGFFVPRHYLAQFLPKFAEGGQAGLDARAKQAGFGTWVDYWFNQADATLNADVPTLTPWVVKKGNEITTDTWIMERNPYSIWVDTAGNQLPYIDTITFSLVQNSDVLHLQAAAGSYDFADRYLDMNKLPVLFDHQADGGYSIYLDPQQACDFGLRFDLAYINDKEIGDLLRTVDFRRAISMGIDRDQINQAFFLGVGSPGSYAPPSPENKYYPGDEARQKWHTLDSAQSNALLDGLGYTAKDANGYRLRKDGKGRLKLTYMCIDPSFADYVGMGEMIKQHWAKIGIDLDVQGLSTNLYSARLEANEDSIIGYTLGSEDLFISNDYVFNLGADHAEWWASGGSSGTEPPADLKELLELWTQGYYASEDQRVEIGKQIWAKASDICLQVGIVGGALSVYGMHLAKNNLGNVPKRVLNSSNVFGSPRQAAPQTFYFKS